MSHHDRLLLLGAGVELFLVLIARAVSSPPRAPDEPGFWRCLGWLNAVAVAASLVIAGLGPVG